MYHLDDISNYVPHQGNVVGQEHAFQDNFKEDTATLEAPPIKLLK